MSLSRDAIGLGLRPAHYAALAEARVALDFFEVTVDNFIGVADLPRQQLARVAGAYPVVGHCVSFDVVGVTALDEARLAAVADLAARHDMSFVTDHLCFTTADGVHHHDLLPPPCRSDLVPWAASRIRTIQHALGVPFGVENVSAYLRWCDDDLHEAAFIAAVCEAADCGLLLDVNNLYISARNADEDPSAWLAALPLHRVLAVHVAGHDVRSDGLRHDTHDRAVDDEVWALYREAWRRGGPFPTILEWDEAIAPLDVAVAHARHALTVRR